MLDQLLVRSQLWKCLIWKGGANPGSVRSGYHTICTNLGRVTRCTQSKLTIKSNDRRYVIPQTASYGAAWSFYEREPFLEECKVGCY